tara:strand:- start:3280 stop:3558 length:279 start_codon:yes stop_codon:yes gene_type:complete
MNKSEQFVVAHLTSGGVFEANNYKELKDEIVDFYSAIDAPQFLGISSLCYGDDNIKDFKNNEELEDLIAKAKQDLLENDKSDLIEDYHLNLI